MTAIIVKYERKMLGTINMILIVMTLKILKKVLIVFLLIKF